MEQASNIVERYCPPTNLDKAEFGTVIKVIVSSVLNEYELYIQLGKQDKPNWQRLGVFFETVFDQEFVSNTNFVETCLELYKAKEDKENVGKKIEDNDRKD